MFTAIYKFFTDEEAFKAALGGMADYMPARAAMIRFAIAVVGVLVNRGVLPGGGTEAGWYASLIAAVSPLLISSGDKTPSMDKIAEQLTERLKTEQGIKLKAVEPPPASVVTP